MFGISASRHWTFDFVDSAMPIRSQLVCRQFQIVAAYGFPLNGARSVSEGGYVPREGSRSVSEGGDVPPPIEKQ